MSHYIFAIPLFFNAVLLIVVGAYSLRFREDRAAGPFAASLFFCAFWAMTYGLEVMSEGQTAKFFWLRARLMVIQFVPLFMLIASSVHTLHTRWLTRLRVVLLFVPALVNILILANRELVHLYIASERINYANPVPTVQYQYGAWGMTIMTYAYVICIVTLAIFLTTMNGSQGVFFKRILTLAIGLSLPFGANFFYTVLNLTPIRGYNIAPNLLLFTALLCGWALTRYQLLSIVPIARHIAVEKMSDALLVTDENCRLIDFNRAAREIFSIRGKQIGRPVEELIPELDKIYARSRTSKTLKDEVALSLAGSNLVFEIVISQVDNDQGRNIGCVITLREITKRKENEERLRQLSKAVEQSPTSVVITDIKGNIQYSNPRFSELTGYSATEALGKNMHLIRSGQTHPRVYEQLWKTIRSGQTWSGTLLNRRKSGELYWEESIISPVFDNNNTIAYFIAVKQDVTTQKHKDDELQKRLKELEILHNISTAATSQLDLKVLVPLVGEQIERAFSVQSVYIAIYDRETNLIEMPYWTIQGARVSAEPLEYGLGLTSRVLQSGEPLLLDTNFDEIAPALGAVLDFEDQYGCPKTWLGVPIFAGGEAIGAISVQDYEREHAFSQEDIRLLQTISAEVGIIIQNARLYEKMQEELESRKRAEEQARRRAEQMSAINAIGRAITSGLELNSVLNALRLRCQQIAPQMDIFSVALYDERTFTFDFLQFYDQGITRPDRPRDIRKKEGGVTGEIIKDKHTIYLPDLNVPEVLRAHTIIHRSKKHARCYLGIPLLVGENIVGVLAGQSYQPNAFSPDQIELLETIALQAAIAVQNASLYEETHRRMQEMESLYGISIALSSNLDLQEVLRRLFEKCRQVLPMDSFYVALYDEETHLISQPLFWDRGKFIQTALRDIRETPGLSGEVILGRKTLYLPDVLEAEIQEKYQVIHAGGKPARCYVGAPMIAHKRVVGVLSMQTYEPDAYLSEHIRLLETIAHQASIAIENSRLYQRAQEELNARRNTLQSLEQANENLQIQLTQVEAIQDKLREQAIRDPLTGLYNRRYLNEQLKLLLDHAQTYEKPLCVIMIDIDHFKSFNDTYSHLAGDQLLQVLSDLLRANTRPNDITCRYGGEEFILVLPETSLDIATRRAEELRRRFEKTSIFFKTKKLHASISIGVAGFPEHGDSAESLTMQADQALYAAKAAGRNKVIVWNTKIRLQNNEDGIMQA